jgi:large subunit ribosomal protein L9
LVGYNDYRGNDLKVAFLKDLANTAKAGDIKEVSDGYARNFLIPRNIAIPASIGITSNIENQVKVHADRDTRLDAELIKSSKEIDGNEVTLEAKAGAKDRLYGRITSSDIAKAIKDSTGFDIDKRKIVLSEPIRQLGNYRATLKLAKDITANIKVIVKAKGA